MHDVLVVDRVVVCSKAPFVKNGCKYFIGYKNHSEKLFSLWTMFPKMSACRTDFEETKYVFFFSFDKR